MPVMGNKEIILSDFDVESLPLSRAKFSRRDLLKGSACFAGAAYLGKESAFMIVDAILDQIDARERSRVSNSEFIWQNSERLRNVRYGCSFALEEFESEEEAMQALKIMVEDWGIKNIRIGLRWSTISQDGEGIDLSKYEKIVEYALLQGVELRWCLGAIKNFGWPEFYVPTSVLGRVSKISGRGERIVDFKELEKKALEYLKNLCIVLRLEYGKLPLVQGTNEGYKEFGAFPWVVHNEYLQEEVKVLNTLGNPRKLFNSSEWHNLEQIDQSLQSLKKNIPQIVETSDIGINYFPEKPWVKNYPLLGRPDSILVGKIVAGDPYSEFRRSRYKKKEVSEAQMEPWLVNGKPVEGATSPGNSCEHLKFVTLRAMENILSDEGGIIYLFGAPKLAKRVIRNRGDYKLTSEHIQMIDLVRRVNFRDYGWGNRLAA